MKKDLTNENQMDELMEVLSEGPCLKIRMPIVQKFNIKVATVFACLENQYENAIKNEKTVDFKFKGFGERNAFCMDFVDIISSSFYEFNKKETWAFLKKLKNGGFVGFHNSGNDIFVFFNPETVKDFQEFPKK